VDPDPRIAPNTLVKSLDRGFEVAFSIKAFAENSNNFGVARVLRNRSFGTMHCRLPIRLRLGAQLANERLESEHCRRIGLADPFQQPLTEALILLNSTCLQL
jgi:hypothetical protein